MSQCKRNKKGRFAKHNIKRISLQWKCIRCGLIVPTMLLLKTQNIVNIPRMVASMEERNELYLNLGVG